MPTEFICGCGTALPAKSCHGKLDRGRRKILPYQWHLRAPVGFDLAHQSKVATYLARTNLGLVLHTGLPDLTIEQPQELVPRDVELIHTIPIPATEDGRVINSIPDSYFWYHPSHVARTTPNVNCLTKSNMNELVSGYSSVLKPVENVTRNSDNITMVVQHFFRQFPNGSVDFIGKPVVNIDIRFARSQSGERAFTTVSTRNDPCAVPIHLSDEQMRERFPWDYAELTEHLSSRYEDFKVNQKYHRLRLTLANDSRFAYIRRLDPDNPRSQTKVYFNTNIVRQFDPHYTVR